MNALRDIRMYLKALYAVYTAVASRDD